MDNKKLRQEDITGTEQPVSAKIVYQPPKLATLGSVAELTRGIDAFGTDAVGGSNAG